MWLLYGEATTQVCLEPDLDLYVDDMICVAMHFNQAVT